MTQDLPYPNTLTYSFLIPTHALVNESDTLEKILNDRVYLLLRILPKGTSYLQVFQSTMEPYTEFTMAFKHPLFESGSKVELDFAKPVWKNLHKEGGYLTDEMLIGVRYLKPDGTLYSF